MTWLRVDDGFAFHPKLVLLSRSERWTWVELLCYCARYKTAGEIPDNVHHVIPKATRAFLTRCVHIGLLDRDEHGDCAIHDWAEYNPRDPTNATRQMRHRNGKRNGEVTQTVTDDAVTKVTPRARASRPVPNPTNKEPFLPSNETRTEPPEGLEGINIGNILKEVDAP